MSMFEDDSYSDGDEDFGDGVDYSSQHSQDWQEQRHQLDEVGQPAAAAGAGGLRGQRADSQQMSTSSARRGKRKGAYTEEERRYRRRLANRESARRMRAKRNQEVKQLENTLNQLQDRNEKLEAQNREYAKSLQQLQQEMHSLRTQLQGNLTSSQQQQSSSEVHQVLSCGTAMHPHQQQMLLQGNNNHGPGLHFSGQLSFTGALNSMPPGIPAAEQRHQAPLAAPLPAAAAAAAVAATGLSALQQQFAAQGSMQGAQACAGGQYLEQQSWQLQSFDQQQQLQHHPQQQVPQMVFEQRQAAYAGTPRGGLSSGGLDNLQQQQQGQAQKLPARTVSEAAAVTVRSPVGVALPHAKSLPQLQNLQDSLAAQQQGINVQQQCSAAAGASAHAERAVAGLEAGAQAAEGVLDAGNFPACADELLNELLMSHTPEQQADAGGADAAAAAATALEAAVPAPLGHAASSLGADQQQQEQQEKQQEQQPAQRMEPPSKPSGFRPWGAVGAGGLGSPASLHAMLQQQAALQKQQEQQHGQHMRAGSAPPPGAAQHAKQLSPAAAIAAIAAGADAAGAGAEQERAAAAAAAMLAARGRAFAGGGYANPANLCGFEIPDIQPVAAPAMQQQPQAPAAAAAAGGAAVMPDPFAAWAHRFVPFAGSTAAVVQQLGNALQLDLPEAAAAAVMAAAAPTAQLQALAGTAGEGATLMPHQGRGSGQHRHSHHSRSLPPAQAVAPAGRNPKRRFPLKQPSRLAAQQVAAVQAAAAAAAGFSDLHTASTVCQGSCGLDWVDAGTAMQAQLEQQKRRRLRKQLHAAAAAVGDEAVRMLSASSRVGGEAGAAPTVSDEVVGAGSGEVAAEAAAALQRGGSVAAAASPTSRPRSATTFPQQYSALWQQHAPAAVAGVPEAVCVQRTFSSVDQRQPAFSVPVDWAGAQLGPELSVAADGCRSYASEPGACADADAAGAAAGSVLDWADGCGTAVEQWSWQLLQLEQQGLITKHAAAGAGAAGRAQQLQQQAQVQDGARVAPYRAGAGDGGMPSPRAAAVLNAAAAAAAATGGVQGQHTGMAPGHLPNLSPQLMQLQQQLQHYLQRNKGNKMQAPVQQRQGTQPAAVHRQLSVQLPQAYGGSGDLDHAVPGSPPAAWLELQQQQQQQYSDGQPLVASKGPAAAAAVQGSASDAAAPSVSQASRGSGATSPKGQALTAPGVAAAGTAAFTPTGLLAATAGGRQGIEPPVGAAVLNPRVPGGIDFGDLDLPEAPPELDALTAMLQHEPQQPGANSGLPLQQQLRLRQDVTNASAGLQGLWLNPDTNGNTLAHTPTGLGFSASVSQGLALGAGGPGVLASPVTARLGLGADSAGPIRAGSSAGMQAPVGMGVGGAEAAASEPGSLQYMAATAAAAGQPPWSTWHEEQQQWLDDIFSSGPTLPHEPDAAP